ncbi:MAG: hypothetical protein R6X33_16660 [Candidatus Brocadiia bacterium]
MDFQLGHWVVGQISKLRALLNQTLSGAGFPDLWNPEGKLDRVFGDFAGLGKRAEEYLTVLTKHTLTGLHQAERHSAFGGPGAVAPSEVN